MRAVRVFLVEDEPSVRKLLGRLLEDDERTVVVGDAASGEEALAHPEVGSADVVTMDVALPGMNGIEVTRRLKAMHPHLRIILVSIHAGYLEESIKAGADGYVVKSFLRDTLVNRLVKAAGG